MARKQVNVDNEKVVEKPEVEEVVETLPKKRKRLNVDMIVEEAIKINNLPIYEEAQIQENAKAEKKVPKKQKISKKQLAAERRVCRHAH